MTGPRHHAAVRAILPRYPARKTPIGELLIWLLVRFAMRRMFVRVRLCIGGEHPREARLPLLAIANHPSWWDGYIALLLSRHFGRPRYLMMEAAQLRRYSFFAWAGCFGVDRTDPHDVARAVTYAAGLLTREHAALLWMFPQAEIVPPAVRPIAVHRGTAHILRRATRNVPVVGVLPVAWQLVFRGEQHPEVFIRTGPILQIEQTSVAANADISPRLQAALMCVMEALQADLTANNLTGYSTIMRGRDGINDRFDHVLCRSRLVPDP